MDNVTNNSQEYPNTPGVCKLQTKESPLQILDN